MRTCKICARDDAIVRFPKTGRICRECKAKALRDRKTTDPDYYVKRKAYRQKNRDKINAQKRQSYTNNSATIKAKNNVYYHANGDACRSRQRAYQARVETATIESWLAKCLKHARFADRRLHRKFDIDLEFLVDLYGKQKGCCAISGVKMTYARNDLFAISIDRISSEGGHTRNNVQLVCQAMNLAKREHDNADLHRFMLATHDAFANVDSPDFAGFMYPESTLYYPLIKKQQVVAKLYKLCVIPFIPPSYSNDEITCDLNRILTEDVSNYTADGWRSHYTHSRGFAGKKIIRQFQRHLWDVRVAGRPLISEAWGNGPIFEKAAWNLVNGVTKISRDRIIRELIFAGAGVVSQMHPGFAKAVYSTFCKKGDIVFDPFAGWGGRLLGAHAAGIRYTANELSELTYDGLSSIAKFVNCDCELHLCDSLVSRSLPASFMFTSPPFGTEEYIGSDRCCDLKQLLEITNHIPIRVIHANRGLLEALQAIAKASRIIPITARTRAGGLISNEYLIIYEACKDMI